MSVKIRLKRMGAKNNPFFRIVVADTRSPRDGRFIEEIGYYDPKRFGEVKLDKERAEHWIKNGAQPSETARVLLKKQGVTL
ncbi:MAG: 30S ribosomal protein S16 [Candidatus Aureabacteria bacterium]|nr:30S ribosomal protein S16 [Candidatus Auribacterota bacterium]MCK5656124.1 30S ribosomal protein S16 [Candidatus Auribacterota bacterium]